MATILLQTSQLGECGGDSCLECVGDALDLTQPFITRHSPLLPTKPHLSHHHRPILGANIQPWHHTLAKETRKSATVLQGFLASVVSQPYLDFCTLLPGPVDCFLLNTT